MARITCTVVKKSTFPPRNRSRISPNQKNPKIFGTSHNTLVHKKLACIDMEKVFCQFRGGKTYFLGALYMPLVDSTASLRSHVVMGLVSIPYTSNVWLLSSDPMEYSGNTFFITAYQIDVKRLTGKITICPGILSPFSMTVNHVTKAGLRTDCVKYGPPL